MTKMEVKMREQEFAAYLERGEKDDYLGQHNGIVKTNLMAEGSILFLRIVCWCRTVHCL